jgi:hypothetical protein
MSYRVEAISLPSSEAERHKHVVHDHYRLVHAGVLDAIKPFLRKHSRQSNWNFDHYFYLGVDADYMTRTRILTRTLLVATQYCATNTYIFRELDHGERVLSSSSVKKIDLTEGQDALIREIGDYTLAQPPVFDIRQHLAKFNQQVF